VNDIWWYYNDVYEYLWYMRFMVYAIYGICDLWYVRFMVYDSFYENTILSLHYIL